MGFEVVQPVARPAPSSGITFAARTRLTGRMGAALILTRAAQQRYFGCEVDGWGASVLIGSGADGDQLALTLLPPATVRMHLRAAPLIKGSVVIRFAAEPFGALRRPAGPCTIRDAGRRTLLLALPPFGQPVSAAPMARPDASFNGSSTSIEGALQ